MGFKRSKFFWGAAAALLAVIPSVPSGCLAAIEEKSFTLTELQQALDTGMEYQRVIALQKLRRRATRQAFDLVVHAMLYDHSSVVRKAAQRELENVEYPPIWTETLKALENSNRAARLAAVDALGLIRTPASADQLLLAMKTFPRDRELVRMALESLRTLVYRVEPAAGFEASLTPYLLDKDPNLRILTVNILGLLGRAGSMPGLLALWDQSDDKLKIRLCDAFSNLGRIEPAARLQAALAGRSRDVVIHALYALAQIQSFSSLPSIRGLLLRQKDPLVLIAGVYALIEIPEPENIPVLIRLLDHPDPSVLHWTVYALNQLGAQNSGPALIQKLGHSAPLVRASACTALGELKIASSQPELEKRIADVREAPEVKIAAARALLLLGNARGADLFWEVLRQPKQNLEILMTCAMALGFTRNESYRERLSAEIDSKDFTRAFLSAVALGCMGDKRARPLLIKALDHGYPSIRRYAILGLENIGDREAWHALADTANDDLDPLVRVLSASSLVHAGFPEFKVILWNALDTAKEDLRSEAVIALGRSPDRETLRQLKWYLRREPSVPVRQTIQRVFREVKNAGLEK